MTEVNLYQIDAFAEKPFTGNPAAIVILDNWIDDRSMQNIAMENNLSETAFLIRKDEVFEIRYFTPKVEVELCGHATLASSYVIFELLGYKHKTITFETTKRGALYVSKVNDIFVLDFPIDFIQKIDLPKQVADAINLQPVNTYTGKTDLLLEYQNEEQIRNLSPSFDVLKKAEARGIIVTAPGNEVDFVSRFFAPREGINEDPVTGSAHTTLIPFWHKRLGKEKMIAKQLSERGGTLYCEYAGERVKIGGKAIHYLTGTITT